MRALCLGPREHAGAEEEQDAPHDELHLAVLTGRTKRIKNLLRKGVHIESVNSHGQTPLFCASFGGDNEVVSLLLRLGANPNRRCGSKGATPVHGAAYRGSRRVLRLLVEAGGDLAFRDYENFTPRDYALKQPSPIRRQKILHFLDLLLAMTLHRSLARGAPHHAAGHAPAAAPAAPNTSPTSPPVLSHSSAATLPHAASKNSLALKRQGSLASVWGACVTDGGDTTPRSPPYTAPPPTSTIHKTVSCHLLDQMYVSTSLPLLTPADLHRPEVTGIAYTCGGPTVYSPFTWLGTRVTVRRPTPALALPKHNAHKGEDRSSLDPAACKSLLQELSVLRRLRHPGFLEVMAACHVASPSPDHVTLVFQHVQYGSLYHHLHVEHRDLSLGGAVEVLVGVVEALMFLHAHNWLHTAVSSHALHLVSTHHAKLGGFEFAMEMHGKGCSMRAPQLNPASWLGPWQAPETLTEQMVSTRSEVYSLTAVIWEVWAGMPPWSGVEDQEVKRRVGAGETLPTLTPTPPSLITYLTQYGLKWNSHERELDLQEIHTMLRSLKIQSNEEERVPVVPAWGPPSVPNTPVIGRHASPIPAKASTPSPASQRSAVTPTKPQAPAAHPDAPQIPDLNGNKQPNTQQVPHPHPQTPNRRSFVDPRKAHSGATQLVVKGEVHQSEESFRTTQGRPRLLQETPTGKGWPVGSVDSGFSTPCTRTPSPNMDTITSAKINPSFLTSTPARPPTTCVMRADIQPDLLPNKVTLKALKNGHTPDILARGPMEVGRGVRGGGGGGVPAFQPPTSPLSPACPTTDSSDHSRTSSPTDPGREARGYGFISNAAKRAFLQEAEGGAGGAEEGGERPAFASRRGSSSDIMLRTEVVRRGISLTNISIASAASHSLGMPRTTSHVSLASASSSGSSDMCGRRPVRTVSQVTLTMRKLSQVSDSSSSKDEVCDAPPQDNARGKRARSLPKSPKFSPTSCGRREGVVSGQGHVEDTAIKPASHQVTRHSSSCSLASGPSSPTHYSSSSPTTWVPLHSARHQQHLQQQAPPPSSSATLPAQPTSQKTSPPQSPNSRSAKGGVGRRWGSMGGTPSGLADAAVKIQPRRHSEGQRPRPRRSRRRQEVEIEEEFFDDEFNALLFQQPHMQLSVGSSENLLDSRAPHSMLADGAASPVSLGFSSFSPSLTSSEDEDDEAGLKRRLAGAATRWRRLGAVKETGNSEEDQENGEEEEEAEGDDEEEEKEKKSCSSRSDGETGGEGESGEGPWRYKEFGKEYEPLKSVQLLRNLRSVTQYLPAHSIASDTDPGEM